MTTIDELMSALSAELARIKEFLARAKNIVELVPAATSRQAEVEAKIAALEALPPDAQEELAPRLLPFQRTGLDELERVLPQLPLTPPGAVYMISPSGTSANFQVTISSLVPPGAPAPQWMGTALAPFDTLAEERLRDDRLSKALDRLDPRLPPLFGLARESISLATTRLIGLDQAFIRMRDVVERTWGALAFTARARDPLLPNHLALRSEVHRQLVASRQTTPSNAPRLAILLDNLHALHVLLSPEAKNPLFSDMPRFTSTVSQWVLLLDDICRLALA